MSVAQTGPANLLVHRTTFVARTESRCHVIDIGPRVEEAVQSAGLRSGVVLVSCLHTTCSIIIAESAAERTDELVRLMERIIRDSEPYRHNDPRWSDCERGNAAAHLRASLLGGGVTIGIIEGTLALGKLQSVLLAEWDGPRSRTVDIQMLGA